MVISPLEHPNKATGDPWDTQPKYSNAIAGTAAGLILCWSIAHHFLKPKLSQHQRPIASYRYLAAQPRSLGTIVLITIAFLIPFTILTFAVQPYYRTLSVYGSPPLALRAGFLALGTLPFLYATSAKVSYLTTLTGVKSETWLVWHAWGARFAMFLATVHTVPFIYQAVQEGGSTQVAYIFKSDNIYTTGILAYVALAILVLPSSRVIRQRCYALWLAIHIPIALVFLVAMWVHCENILTSWRFMYAATFFYLLNIALRVGRWLQHSDFLMHTTVHLSVFTSSSTSTDSDSLTRIVVPTMARWRPGQHVYLRLFPSIPSRASSTSFSLFSFARFWIQSAAHSHPFTIVSLPPEDRHAPLGHMVLFARATRRKSGWTTQLAEWVRVSASASNGLTEDEKASVLNVQWTAIVDGPYGSISTPSLLDPASTSTLSSLKTDDKDLASVSPHQRHISELERRSPLARHDGVLFICGGSGITYPLGLLLELIWARSKAEGLGSINTVVEKEAGHEAKDGQKKWPQKVLFVWSVRNEAHIAWAEEQLRIATELVTGDWLEIIVHVTGHQLGDVLSTTLVPSVPATDSLRPAAPTRIGSSSTSSEQQEDTSEKSVSVSAHTDLEEAADVVPILGKEQDSSSSASSAPPWVLRRGERIEPDLLLKDFLGSLVSTATGVHRPRVGLVVCGPTGLADGTVRAANGVQLDIARGRGTDLGGALAGSTRVVQVGEMEVFREDFGW
ncbi:unnamed protein product [Tilletia controversa]|nr:unnamed protein product [Tilletia controversa]